MWAGADFFLIVGVIVVTTVVVVVGAILTEMAGPVTRWLQARSGFGDPEQSTAVRAYALKLGSSKRKARLTSIQRLGDLNDYTAVPALLKVIDKYSTDGPLMETVVVVLGKLADERALPGLHRLSHGRHQSLMEAARDAVAAIEPKSILLRPAVDKNEHLLRSSNSAGEADSALLLRPHSE